MNIRLSEKYVQAIKELERNIAELINDFERNYEPLLVESWEM